MNYENLDLQHDQDIIIPRALFMTNKNTFIEDIEKLENIYSSVDIIRNLKATKERISNEVCQMVADRYAIPTFRRYSLK